MRSLIGSAARPFAVELPRRFPLSRRAISLTVLAVNLLGDQLRAWIDPRLGKTRRNDL